MQTYNGAITIKTFESGDTSDTLTTFNNDTLKKLSDHTHEGSGAGNPIHGTNAIQAGTITAASIQDSTITSGKLAAQLSFDTISNDTYLKWRNNANSADLNVLKVNTSDNLEVEQKLDKIQISNNVVLKGTTAASGDHDLFKVTTSDKWEFQNDAYVKNTYPITDSTYDLGSTSLRWSNIHTDSIRFVNGGNDLTWYKEGTWTPTIEGSTSAGTASYTVQVGTYTRIGRIVLIFCNVTWSSGTGTGNLRIAGLPYTVKNLTNYEPPGPGLPNGAVLYLSDNKQTGVIGEPNTTNVIVTQINCNTTTSSASQEVTYPASGNYRFTLMYEV